MKQSKIRIIVLLLCINNFAFSAPQSAATPVFVSELVTHTRDFSMPSETGPVVALSVSTCHLLEISNTDANGKRTVFSLTHFTQNQLNESSRARAAQLVSNMESIIDDFQRAGGDLETAKVVIRGGHALESEHRQYLRQNLKKALRKGSQFSVNFNFEEPNETHLQRRDVSVDYAFFPKKTYVVKSLGGATVPAGWEDVFYPRSSKTFWEQVIDPAYRKVSGQVAQRHYSWVVQHPDLPVFRVGLENQMLSDDNPSRDEL